MKKIRILVIICLIFVACDKKETPYLCEIGDSEFDPYIDTLELIKKGIKEIPDCIGNFKLIKYLDLSGNYIMNLPESFNNLQELEFLNLKGNLALDIEDMVKRSEYIITDENTRSLKKLKYLNIDHTGLDDNFGYHFLGNFKNLEYLSISNNKIENFDIDYIVLNNLKTLNISSCELNSIPIAIFNFDNLKKLNLSSNYISGIPDWMNQMQKLQDLDLSSNKIFKMNLHNMRSLNSLKLRYNYIYELDENIFTLKKIEYLDLAHNKLKKLPYMFSSLFYLKELDLTGNKIDIEGLMPLLECTNLRILHLSKDYYNQAERNVLQTYFNNTKIEWETY